MPALEVSSTELWRWRIFASLLFLLPLHTVGLDLGFTLKPFMVPLLVLVVMQFRAIDWRWPWDRGLTVGAGVFLLTVMISWRPSSPARFFWLAGALSLGLLLLLVVSAEWRRQGSDRCLEVIAWSGLAMGGTAVLLGLLATGALGAGVLDRVSDLTLVTRVWKEGYLASGFFAVTNWHQDPGYAASWSTLWLVFTALSWARKPRFFKVLAIALLASGVFLTLSRAGWLGIAVVAPLSLFVGLEGPGWTRLRVIGKMMSLSLPIAAMVVATIWVVDPKNVDLDLGSAVGFRMEQALSLGTIDGRGLEGDILDEADTRAVAWPRYLDYFKENPLRGSGLGSGWEEGQEPHSLGLQLLGELGMIGLLGFFFLGWNATRFGVGRVGLAAVLLVLFQGLTQTVLFEPTLWLAGAVMVGSADRS